MRNPIPNPTPLACDYNASAQGKHCPYECAKCGAPTYAADEACPCVCADEYPGLPVYGGSDPSAFPDQLYGHEFHSYAIGALSHTHTRPSRAALAPSFDPLSDREHGILVCCSSAGMRSRMA